VLDGVNTTAIWHVPPGAIGPAPVQASLETAKGTLAAAEVTVRLMVPALATVTLCGDRERSESCSRTGAVAPETVSCAPWPATKGREAGEGWAGPDYTPPPR
jgi:hypothetical protein